MPLFPLGAAAGRELMPAVSVVVPAVSAGVQIVRGKHLLPFKIAFQTRAVNSGLSADRFGEGWGPILPSLPLSILKETQRERRSIQPRQF